MCGAVSMPRVSARKEIVKAIAEALNVSPTWLLTGEGARDSAEASLPPTDPKAEPQMFGAEVFDRLYEMAQEALDGYGPHSVPLEARRVILPLVSRIYAEQGPAPFLPPERWVTYEWKGWETQQKEFGSSDPGVTPQDIRYLQTPPGAGPRAGRRPPPAKLRRAGQQLAIGSGPRLHPAIWGHSAPAHQARVRVHQSRLGV